MKQRVIGVNEKQSAKDIALFAEENKRADERIKDISLAVAMYRKQDKYGIPFSQAMFFATIIYEQDGGAE